jgi:hypothetical protein
MGLRPMGAPRLGATLPRCHERQAAANRVSHTRPTRGLHTPVARPLPASGQPVRAADWQPLEVGWSKYQLASPHAQEGCSVTNPIPRGGPAVR